MVITQTPLLCFLAINHTEQDCGWSEAWHLPNLSPFAARANAIILAQARSYLLAKNHVIEWASVRSLTSPYWEWAAIGDALPALPQWDVVDNDHTGLLWRFQTSTGRWANHLFRAVEDGEIADQLWTRAPFLIPGTFVAPPATPSLATKDQLYRYVLATFRDLTCHARRQDPSDPSNHHWELTPWQDAIYRKVSSRAWGSKYHRVSWEAEDWTQSPGFTPCGTAVTVLRTVYAADCRFFSAGPTQRILYYYADDAAAVFPYQSIFWGMARAKDISNPGTDPGETTGPAARTYSFGWSWGSAPGIAPDGPPAAFMGQTVSPWGSSPTTPPIYRIPCDMPIPGLQVYDTALTVDQLNVTLIGFDSNWFTVIDNGPGAVVITWNDPGIVIGSGTDNAVAVWNGTRHLDAGTLTDDATTATATKRFATPWVTISGLGATATLLNVGDSVFVRLKNSGSPCTIDSILGATDGRWLVLWFEDFEATLVHSGASLPFAYTFATETGHNVVCKAGTTAMLRYSVDDHCWLVHTVQEASHDQAGLISWTSQWMGKGTKCFDAVRIGIGPTEPPVQSLTSSNFEIRGIDATVLVLDANTGGFTQTANLWFKTLGGQIQGIRATDNTIDLFANDPTATSSMTAGLAADPSFTFSIDAQLTATLPAYGIGIYRGIYSTLVDYTTGNTYTVKGGIITDMVPGSPPSGYTGTVTIGGTVLTFLNGDLVSVSGGIIGPVIADEMDLILEFDEVVIYAPVLAAVIPDEFDLILEFDEVVIYASTIDPVIADEFELTLEFDETVIYSPVLAAVVPDEFDLILEFSEVVIYVPAGSSLVHDTFTDTDATLLTAHTADTGQSWSDWNVSYLSPVISGNAAIAPAPDQWYSSSIDSGITDMLVQFDLTTSGGTFAILALARVADSANYIQVVVTESFIQLADFIAGSPTVLASDTPTLAAGTYTIQLVANGTAITVNLLSGLTLITQLTATSSAGGPSTLAGFGVFYSLDAGPETCSVDDFDVSVP